MNTTSIVFAVTLAIISGLYAGYRTLKRDEKELGTTATAGAVVGLVGLFCSTVVAAEAAWWSYIAGGVPALVISGLLIRRLLRERKVRKDSIEEIRKLCPNATWDEAATFYQALSVLCGSIALISVGGSQKLWLPLATLERVYRTRLVECQRLGFEDFRTECFYELSFRDMSGLAERAALLIFVESTEVAYCQEWFVECTTILNAIATGNNEDLGEAIQYIWQKDIVPQSLKLDLTLNAAQKMSPMTKLELCAVLDAMSPNNSWLQAHLPAPPRKKDEATETSSIDPPAAILLGKWYTPGTVAKCQMCGSRPLEIPFAERIFSQMLQSISGWLQICSVCKYHTLEYKKISDPVPVEKEDDKSKKTISNGARKTGKEHIDSAGKNASDLSFDANKDSGEGPSSRLLSSVN